MNSFNSNNDSQNISDKVFIYANLDLLFEFKSILIAIIRFFHENSEKFKNNNLNGKFFESIELKNVKQFVNDVVEKMDSSKDLESEREILNELKSELVEKIFNCKEFECVKPRLFFLFRFYYLIQIIKKNVSVEDIVIKLSSNEIFFIDLIKKLNLLAVVENLFGLKQNTINLIYFSKDNDNMEEYFEDKSNYTEEKLIFIFFDNRLITMDNLYLLENEKFNNADSNKRKENPEKNLFFYPNTKIQGSSAKFQSEDNQSINFKFDFEKFLSQIFGIFHLNYEIEIEKYKGNY